MDIIPGLKGQAQCLVTENLTAAAVGSGSLAVYATPSMVALMEEAACNAIAACLPPEQTSVGIELNICHTAATPVAMAVRAEAEVIGVDGKIISFTLHAYDAVGEIGAGTHKRAIVNSEKFLQRTNAKR